MAKAATMARAGVRRKEQLEQERRAITVAVHRRRLDAQDSRERIAELNGLAAAAGLDALVTQPARVYRPHPAHYIGAGAVDALAQTIATVSARRVVFDCELSVTQARNLEKMLNVTVSDRADLILEIFSRRATSYEGKLQVELARCRREMARLAGLWTHLERQRGGIGIRGGPGEKQMELDRRMLAQKARRLERQIEKMAQRKQLARGRRQGNGVMTAALVGYTNAGKTTLFNLLARQKMLSDDRLFVTLDSTARRVYAENNRHYILSDTVGFIRDLPHELIAGFRATLEDAASSDLLIIVIDGASGDSGAHLQMVEDIHAGMDIRAQHRIIVYNKMDKLGEPARAHVSECGKMRAVYISCNTGEGVCLLKKHIAEIAALYS